MATIREIQLPGSSIKHTIDAQKALQDANGENLTDKVSVRKLSSRASTLITNGTGVLKTNYNFSGFTFDGLNVNGCAGSFKRSSKGLVEIDELIAVDPSKTYEWSFDIMSDTNTMIYYFLIACYDIDGNLIRSNDNRYYCEPVELSQDLVDGDTVIHFTDLGNWNESSSYRGIIIWNYANSLGYVYPPKVYSRKHYNSIYTSSSDVDKINNTITLSSPWSHGVIPKGTKVSQYATGSTYTYLLSGLRAPGSWLHKQGTVSGISTLNTNEVGTFNRGTAYCKLGWLWNYTDLSGVVGYICNISFKEMQKNTQTLLPMSDGTCDIGSTSLKYANVYGDTFSGRAALSTGSNQVEYDANGNKQLILSSTTYANAPNGSGTATAALTRSNAFYGNPYTGILTAKTGFKTSNGRSSQFLKADGSVDSNDYALRTDIPEISTNIADDATSTTKTASPKSVKTYVDNMLGNIESILQSIRGI